MSEKALKLIAKEKEERTGRLNLGNCGLTEWPKELFELTWLEELVVGNGWEDKEGYYYHRYGQNLQNRLRYIPTELGQLPNLQLLFLNSMGIQKIENLDNLTALTELDLSYNEIQRIENLENLTALTKLDLSKNQIMLIENLEKLDSLTDLNLKNNKIECIENLDNLKILNRLQLSFNKIQRIENLDKLTTLNSLFLAHNQITRIENLENHLGLNSLFLPYNHIERIENLDNLIALSMLFLNSNKINKIENLDRLTVLKNLDLSDNQIRQMENLDNLTALRVFDISFNQIQSIENIENLTNLIVLNVGTLKAENLKNISIKAVKILEQLKYWGIIIDPIKNVSIKNWKNKNEILGYIKSFLKPRIPNTFLKLNIIGDGRIGKTQLIHFFNEKEKKYIEREKETHGTNTEIYFIPNTDYQATIWDFGGQSYHHGFHQMFIREQDFNLVLWRNVAGKKPDYGYWLGTARAFSQKKDESGKYLSPLWLVQNVWTSTDYLEEKDGFKPDKVYFPDSKKLQHYQVGFEQVYAVDVKSLFQKELSIENIFFIHRLHEVMNQHVKVLGEVPEEFAAIKQRLDIKDLRGGWKIEKARFKELYAPEMDIDLFEYLLSYLEFSGNIISFNEKAGKHLLKDYILTSPPKLSDWIYKDVLEKIGVREQAGSFTRNQLKKVLNNEIDTQLFIDILDQYDLFFVKEEQSEKKYTLPQYLPDYNHSFKTTLLKLLPYTFSLCFEDFLHEGRFFNFMSKYGKYAIDDTAYWKYGILFQYKSKTIQLAIEVLVYYKTENRQIQIHIEDKKGKTEIAKELFDFFVFNKKPNINQDKSSLSEEMQGIEGGKDAKEKEQRDFEGIYHVSLSTIENQYFDIQETHQNIIAKNYFGICTQTQKRIPLDYMALNLLGNEAGRKLRIFFSYSHKDETYRDELDKHFSMLKRNGRIETWYDRKIIAGSDWNEKIKHQLEMADIVLLMISANFLHSDYIWEQELGIVRTRIKNNDGICVIPIFVEECDTEGLDLMKFQGGTKDDQGKLRWIASEPNRAKLYLENVENIKKAINKMQ